MLLYQQIIYLLHLFCIYSLFIENLICFHELQISTCILNLNKFSFEGKACYIKFFSNMY